MLFVYISNSTIRPELSYRRGSGQNLGETSANLHADRNARPSQNAMTYEERISFGLFRPLISLTMASDLPPFSAWTVNDDGGGRPTSINYSFASKRRLSDYCEDSAECIDIPYCLLDNYNKTLR